MHNSENLQCNPTTERYFRSLFAGEEVSSGIRTTNCGKYDILCHSALAPTMEEHQQLYLAKCEAEKQERIRKAEEAQQKRLAEWHEQRKGWYHVEVDIQAMTMHHSNVRYLMFSGDIIANSKMDAYNQLNQRDDLINYCASRSLIYMSHDDWTRATVHFLGMKTDYGYSVEAWEEWNENNNQNK